MAKRNRIEMDLTLLLEKRVHLTGFNCAALRALRDLQAVFGALPGGPHIEFWQRSNTNPEKVKCVDCWREHPEVAKTFISRVVIDIRKPVSRFPRP